MLSQLTASVIQGPLTLYSVLICTLASLILGLGIALVYMSGGRYNKGFVTTLALLPMMVQIIIMLVNGNLGTGVAVAGAFSLIRFRSVPGSARDIGMILFSMAIGLATGMGYMFYATLFFLLVGAAFLLLSKSSFAQSSDLVKSLKISIPENLDYDGVFDEIFQRYTHSAELERVKTTNMGSLFELSYTIRLKQSASQKEFLDELRRRNGNLSIVCGRLSSNPDEL